MDFEERLARAERSDSPSLVGASLRSADDSPHKNYIHPEKYVSSRAESRSKSRTRSSKLKLSITASLDDLINEGALLGSEEDFDKFLDSDGTVKNEAKYTNKLDEEGIKEEDEGKESIEPEEIQQKIKKAIEGDEPLRGRSAKVEGRNLEENPVGKEIKPTSSNNAASSFYKQSDYSTPNLSDYQLDQNITDHNDFVSHVKSYNLEKLPRSNLSVGDDEKASTLSRPPFHTTLSSAQQQRLESSLHPFHTDRPRSRSRSANPTSRIAARSSSSSSHLARGDSYKNVHGDEPSKYELPPSFSNDELKESEEEDRGRAARPTLGDSIAAAEARKARGENDPFIPEFESNPISREPSLVTTGDYTNFEVDNPRSPVKYKPNARFIRSSSSHPMDEKNDSNVDGLMEEGALVTDDPYASIDQLDSLMEEVLQGKKESGLKEGGEKVKLKKHEKTDLKDEGDAKKKGSLVEEKGEDLASPESNEKSMKEDEKNVGDVTTSVKKEIKDEVTSDEPNEKVAAENFDSLEATESKDTEEEENITSSKEPAKDEKESTHEELIEEDAKRAEVEGNEKDDADTTTLKEEGALTSEDPFELVEETELREGVPTDDSKEKKSKVPEERKEDDNAKLRTSKTKPEDNLIQGSLNTDGPADLENIEKEENEGLKENAIEQQEENEGKIPKDEQAELDSAEKNKPNLIVGGADEIELVDKEDSEESKPKEQVNDEAPSNEGTEIEALKSKDIDSSKLSKQEQVDDELQAGKDKTDGEPTLITSEEDSSDKLLRGTLNADGPEELIEEKREHTGKDVQELHSKKDAETTEETGDKKEHEVKDESIKTAESEETESADDTTPTAESTKEDETPEEVEATKDTQETKLSDTSDRAAVSKEAETEKENTESAAAEKGIDAVATKVETGSGSTVKSPEGGLEESPTTKPEKKADVIDEFDDLEDISPEEIRKHLELQPIYIFTSLAGGAQIIPRTNRLATILQANGIKFEYRDLGTDEEAKKIWRRQAAGKTLPGVVRGDDFVGNWQEIDEANEEYQVKDLLYSF